MLTELLVFYETTSHIFAKFYNLIHDVDFLQFRPVTELTICHGVDKRNGVDHIG